MKKRMTTMTLVLLVGLVLLIGGCAGVVVAGFGGEEADDEDPGQGLVVPAAPRGA